MHRHMYMHKVFKASTLPIAMIGESINSHLYIFERRSTFALNSRNISYVKN